MKLKRLRGKLKILNSEIFQNIYTKIQQATTLLDEIQKNIAAHGDSDDQFNMEMN